jgi:uncharacterized LabA/DUF88 family protein
MTESSASGSTPSPNNPGSAEPRGRSFSRNRSGGDLLYYTSPTVTAVMVDAAFYLRKARAAFGPEEPEQAAQTLHRYALDHLNDDRGRRTARLYRIFVYDAPPVSWKGHTPIGKRAIDLDTTPQAHWRRRFHQALRGKRKVALRLGEIPTSQVEWQLKPQVLKDLASGRRTWDNVTDDDFKLSVRQKGVDMRLGLDVASLAYQRNVNQIVLISGDADFVPAAKLARRLGIDFILDPMGATIRPALYEHIDGLRSVLRRRKAGQQEPGSNPEELGYGG